MLGSTAAPTVAVVTTTNIAGANFETNHGALQSDWDQNRPTTARPLFVYVFKWKLTTRLKRLSNDLIQIVEVQTSTWREPFQILGAAGRGGIFTKQSPIDCDIWLFMQFAVRRTDFFDEKSGKVEFIWQWSDTWSSCTCVSVLFQTHWRKHHVNLWNSSDAWTFKKSAETKFAEASILRFPMFHRQRFVAGDPGNVNVSKPLTNPLIECNKSLKF